MQRRPMGTARGACSACDGLGNVACWDLLRLNGLNDLLADGVQDSVNWVENHAASHVAVASLLVGGDHAEVQLESVSKRRDALGTTGVLGDNDGLFPIGNVLPDPAGNERLGVEVVDRALEEALHLRSVQIDCDDVLNTSNAKKIGQHSRSDGAAMRLLLGLATVGEVRQDG